MEGARSWTSTGGGGSGMYSERVKRLRRSLGRFALRCVGCIVLSREEKDQDMVARATLLVLLLFPFFLLEGKSAKACGEPGSDMRY